MFALPRGDRIRAVPLPGELAKVLKQRLKKFPATDITLPWATPDGEPQTHRLIFTDTKATPTTEESSTRASDQSKVLTCDDAPILPVISKY